MFFMGLFKLNLRPYKLYPYRMPYQWWRLPDGRHRDTVKLRTGTKITAMSALFFECIFKILHSKRSNLTVQNVLKIQVVVLSDLIVINTKLTTTKVCSEKK